MLYAIRFNQKINSKYAISELTLPIVLYPLCLLYYIIYISL